MKIFNKLFLLLLFPIYFYGQQNIIIEFNTKSQIYYEESTLDTINILKANISSRLGKFSLQLIDFNKNNVYDDFGKIKNYAISEISITNRPDGFYISKFNANYINLLHSDRIRILKDRMLFVVNGRLLEMSNLRKISKLKYTAVINAIKLKDKVYTKIIKNNYLTFTDNTNSICITSIKNNKKINIENLLKNKYLYINFIDANLLLDSPSFVAINFLEKYYGPFKNIDIIYIIINSSKKMIENFISIRKLDYDIYYLDEFDYKSRILLGCNDYPQSSLFNEKGKIVREYIFPFDLEYYDK